MRSRVGRGAAAHPTSIFNSGCCGRAFSSLDLPWQPEVFFFAGYFAHCIQHRRTGVD